MAEPAPLIGKLAQTDAQPGVRLPTSAIADHLAASAETIVQARRSLISSTPRDE